MPRVSILLTCYNHLEFLKIALDGVYAQTFTDYEIIAIDDGSTDGTREWLSENRGEIKLIFNEINLGTYATLNVGLDNAQGEFIAILNDDDLWRPDKLALQVAMMDANPKIGLIGTGGWFVGADGKPLEEKRPLGFPYPQVETGYRFSEFMSHNRIITSSAMFRRECVAHCGPFNSDFYGCGDWHMWIRISERYDVGYLDQKLTHYRIHGTNACLDEDRMNDDTWWIRTWLRKLREEKPKPYFSKENQAYALNEAAIGTELAWRGDMPGARECYFRSLRVFAFRWKTFARILATLLPKKTFRSLN